MAGVQGKNLFVSGIGGAGKSTAITTLVKLMTTDGAPNNPLVTAATGPAVNTLQERGIEAHTLHSACMLPVNGRRYASKDKTARLQQCAFLLIDEISMISAEDFGHLDAILRGAMGRPSLPFGGKQIVLVGDMLQLLPVQGACMFQSAAWEGLRDGATADGVTIHPLESYYLTKSMRVKGDDEDATKFTDALNAFRVRDEKRIDDAIEWINAKCVGRTFPQQDRMPAVKIYPRKKEVQEINDRHMAMFKDVVKCKASLEIVYGESMPQGKTRRDISAEAQKAQDKANGTRFLNELKIADGMQVMHTINDPVTKLYNGITGVVASFFVVVSEEDGSREVDAIMVEWTNGTKTRVEKHDFEFRVKVGTCYATAMVKQFPLIPTWAITLHKAQSVTLERAAVDLNNSFGPHMVAMALSRVTSVNGLTLKIPITHEMIRIDRSCLEFDQWLKSTSKCK